MSIPAARWLLIAACTVSAWSCAQIAGLSDHRAPGTGGASDLSGGGGPVGGGGHGGDGGTRASGGHGGDGGGVSDGGALGTSAGTSGAGGGGGGSNCQLLSFPTPLIAGEPNVLNISYDDPLNGHAVVYDQMPPAMQGPIMNSGMTGPYLWTQTVTLSVAGPVMVMYDADRAIDPFDHVTETCTFNVAAP